MKKKKESENLCNKFKSNPVKFFSRPPCQVILKSLNIKSEDNTNQNSIQNNIKDTNRNFLIKKGKNYNSVGNTPNKVKGENLIDIINNINLEDNMRELELDSKVLTHQTFSNLSWISKENSVDKDFLSPSPDRDTALEGNNK